MKDINYGFITPDCMDYTEIVRPYQEAFKEDPWNEASKCEDTNIPKRCNAGFSRLEVGESCADCLNVTVRPAYESTELIDRLSKLAETRPTMWYVERTEKQVALAAVSWMTTAARLSAEKYAEVPLMNQYLSDTFGDKTFVYLDEIFRDKTVKPQGNLWNFEWMVDSFCQEFGNNTFVFRTKNERLISKTKRIFGADSVLSVPDTRLLIAIDATRVRS
jgi:hypothetical protein